MRKGEERGVAVAEEGTYDPKQLRELCLRHCSSIALDQNALSLLRENKS